MVEWTGHKQDTSKNQHHVEESSYAPIITTADHEGGLLAPWSSEPRACFVQNAIR